jgi:hypothetical protein
VLAERFDLHANQITQWKNQMENLAVYRRIFLRYRLAGDSGLLKRGRIGLRVLKEFEIRADWYDTRATL